MSRRSFGILSLTVITLMYQYCWSMAVKFKHKVVSVSAFVLLFALLVLSVIQYLSVRAAIKTQTAQSINEIIQGIGNTVTAQMKGATDLAALTTNLVAATDTLEGAFPILSQPQLTNAFLLMLSLVINWLLKPLDEINTAMAAIAKGNADLTVRLNTNHEPEFSALATNFNAFTNTLRTLIVNIQRSGHEVLSDAQHTSHVAAQSRQAIETQLETIRVLNNATTHMSETEHQVTKCAQEAAQAIKDTDQVAIQGEAIVAETTNTIGALSNQISSAMNVVTELESSSTAIEQILSVINSIAEQTNLLALNAAIEAARAGESGRGFAVVADEVRSLAQRTQEATTEIRGMINQLQSGSESAVTVMKQSQDYVEKTVDKAEQTRHALEDMRSAIRHIVELNSRIADMLHEQNDIVSNVNNSSASIKEISESVYNEARSVDSTMQSQVDKITGQEQLLEQFKV